MAALPSKRMIALAGVIGVFLGPSAQKVVETFASAICAIS